MPITGLESSISPQITKARNNRIIRRTVQYDRDYDFEAEMPAEGDFDATHGYFVSYASNPRGPYIDVTLTYDTEGTVVNFIPGNGDEEFFATSTGREVPLEYSPNYRTKWNHFLYARNDGVNLTIADFPGGQAGYDAATDLDDLNGNTKLSWTRNLLASPKWVKLKDPEKPGQQAFLAAATTVTRRSWYRSQTDAENDLQSVITTVIPDETFGATPSAVENWLIHSADTQHDGRYWVTTVVYVHSTEGWDSDFYGP